MGFFSDIIDGFTGKGGADAAKDGAAAQVAATEKGIALQRETRDLIREDLSPFTDLGSNNVNKLQNLSTNGQFQADFVNNDPFHKWMLKSDRHETMNNKAARGKLGSGETLLELQRDALRNGNATLDRGINRVNNLVNIGQNSAAMTANNSASTANNITDLLAQGANAQAAGGIGAANAHAQGANNLIALGMAAFSDRRLKRNITRVGEYKGFPTYEYQYLWSDEKYIGVMAQDVPHAAFRVGNYLAVDYGAI